MLLINLQIQLILYPKIACVKSLNPCDKELQNQLKNLT